MMAPETVVTVENNQQANKPAEGEDALAWIKININYFKTIPGLLKLAQLVIGIICMACASPAFLSGTHWFLFVAVTSFIASLIWMFVYLLGIREALKLPINWLLTELLNTAIVTIFYTIAFIVQLSVWSPYPYNVYYKGPNIAAGVFGLFNTLVYGYSTYLLYLDHKSTAPAS